MPTVRRYRGRMLRALLAAALLLAGCAGPGPRGYYRPAGVPPQESLAAWFGKGDDALVEARCQGCYEDEVEGARTGTVHVQLDVARIRSGDLVIPRDSLVVELPSAGGGEPRRLAVTEAYTGRHHVKDDLLVPEWTRRPFDLFFDDPQLLANGPPARLRLSWEQHVGSDVQLGACEFTLIADDDPYAPSRLPPADEVFGLRNGYYLPGVRLGARRLHALGEERLHYLYHEPE